MKLITIASLPLVLSLASFVVADGAENKMDAKASTNGTKAPMAQTSALPGNKMPLPKDMPPKEDKKVAPSAAPSRIPRRPWKTKPTAKPTAKPTKTADPKPPAYGPKDGYPSIMPTPTAPAYGAKSTKAAEPTATALTSGLKYNKAPDASSTDSLSVSGAQTKNFAASIGVMALAALWL